MSDKYPQFHVFGLMVKGSLFKTIGLVTNPDLTGIHMFDNSVVNRAELICDLTTRTILKNRFSESNKVDDMVFGLFANAKELGSDKVVGYVFSPPEDVT